MEDLKMTPRQKKIKNVANKVGVSTRQIYNYLSGRPVPSPKVYYVIGAMGGDVSLWVQNGRGREKKELFEKVAV